jgi:hypothetical protein
MPQRVTGPADSTAAERVPSQRTKPQATGTPVAAAVPPAGAGTVAYLQRMQALAGNQAVQGLIDSAGQPPRPPQAPRHRPTAIGIQRTYTGSRSVQRVGSRSVQRAGDAEPGTGQPAPASVPGGAGWTATGKQVLVHQPSGANLRDQPAPEEEGSFTLEHLTQNTRVLSLRHNPATHWHAVRIVDGEHAGSTGYLADWLVRDDAPDPGAVVYNVQSGDHLRTVVQNHPQYASYPIVTGDDARSLVMAVYTANQNGSGVRLVGDADGGLFDSALDTLDDYRAVTRRIYQTIELVGGEQIWLPGVAYVNSLKSDGTIPQRADWKNAAIEFGKRVAGLQLGLTEGLIGSVVDLLTGMFDLAKGAIDLIISTITGEVFGAIGELLDFLGTLVEEGQILQFAKDVAAGLVHSVIDAGKGFVKQWNAPLAFDAWRFRGKVVGYVLAEVLMAFLSGGLSALKWLDKLGDVGKIARRVISKVENATGDLPLPGRGAKGADVPDAKAGRRFDGDDQLEPDRLAVVLKARALAEVHDTADTPVNMAVATLNAAFKASNPWINEFSAQPKAEPGHYRIIMRTTIDDDYTTGRASGPTPFPRRTLRGVSLSWLKKHKPRNWQQVTTRDHEGFIWKDENGVERLRYMRPSGKNPANSKWSRQANGYFRWQPADSNPSNPTFLDIDGNVVPQTAPDFAERTHIMYEGPR